jgi:hypothetical protein
MKGNLGFAIAAVVLAAPFGLFLPAGASTVDLGSALPSGTVPNGYGGFNWAGAINDSGDAQFFFTSAPAADVSQFSRAQPFDLTSVVFQNWESEVTGLGQVSNYATVISGYLNKTLVRSVTENYPWGQGVFSGLNIDDVNKITFATTAHITDTFCCDGSGNPITVTEFNGPDTTFVSSVTVKNAARAPEVDPASAASALTLLLGGLAVLRGGRRAQRRHRQARGRRCGR